MTIDVSCLNPPYHARAILLVTTTDAVDAVAIRCQTDGIWHTRADPSAAVVNVSIINNYVHQNGKIACKALISHAMPYNGGPILAYSLG